VERRDQTAENIAQRAESREWRVERRDQTAENIAQRAEIREERVESRERRGESKERCKRRARGWKEGEVEEVERRA
jgi:hypothetical protein